MYACVLMLKCHVSRKTRFTRFNTNRYTKCSNLRNEWIKATLKKGGRKAHRNVWMYRALSLAKLLDGWPPRKSVMSFSVSKLSPEVQLTIEENKSPKRSFVESINVLELNSNIFVMTNTFFTGWSLKKMIVITTISLLNSNTFIDSTDDRFGDLF